MVETIPTIIPIIIGRITTMISFEAIITSFRADSDSTQKKKKNGWVNKTTKQQNRVIQTQCLIRGRTDPMSGNRPPISHGVKPRILIICK